MLSTLKIAALLVFLTTSTVAWAGDQLEVSEAPQVQTSVLPGDESGLQIKLLNTTYSFAPQSYDPQILKEFNSLSELDRATFLAHRVSILKTAAILFTATGIFPGTVHMVRNVIYRYTSPNQPRAGALEHGRTWVEGILRNIDQACFVSSRTIVRRGDIGFFGGGSASGGILARNRGLHGAATILGTLGISPSRGVATLSSAAIPERTVSAETIASPFGAGLVFGVYIKDPSQPYTFMSKGKTLNLPGPLSITSYADAVFVNINLNFMDWMFVSDTQAARFSTPTIPVPLTLKAFSAFYSQWSETAQHLSSQISSRLKFDRVSVKPNLESAAKQTGPSPTSALNKILRYCTLGLAAGP